MNADAKPTNTASLTTPGGARLTYEHVGEGTPVLLVHSSPGTAGDWRMVIPELGSGYRVVAPNLPGYGGSDPRPPGEPQTDYMAKAVETLTEMLDGPVLLAGYSYGGNVALRIALRGRLPVAGLILLEPPELKILEAVGDVERYAAAKAVFDDYLARAQAGEPQAVRLMVDFWFGPRAFESMPERLRQFLEEHTTQSTLDVRSAFNERPSLDELGRLTYPVLVVYGGSSPEISRHIVEAIARSVPSGEVRCLAGANHAMPATHAPEIAALIEEMAVRCFPES